MRLRPSPLLVALTALAGCGGGSATDAVPMVEVDAGPMVEVDAFLLGDDAGLDDWLGAWLDERGLPWAPEVRLVDRSDHAAFREAGVPIAAIFAGAEGILSDEEAALFGGTAGEPYDTCYHRPCDEEPRVDLPRARIAAQAIGALAEELATRD